MKILGRNNKIYYIKGVLIKIVIMVDYVKLYDFIYRKLH